MDKTKRRNLNQWNFLWRALRKHSLAILLVVSLTGGCQRDQGLRNLESVAEPAAVEQVRDLPEITIQDVAPERVDLPGEPVAKVRFATFNVSLYRQSAGELQQELALGQSLQPAKIAEIIQRLRPDVLLLNEFDFDETGVSLKSFQKNYLGVSQRGQDPIEYPYTFVAASNTGIDSGLDFDSNAEIGTPQDAFGFGLFPGQYGMAVLSKYPIRLEEVRTFQNFLWKDMPDPLWPIDPETKESYYSDQVKEIFRLSSKSHWDVPIEIDGRVIHLLASHPTPPVFDGPEDRNGARNHDEIRFWADYISGAEYPYDDQGRKGGLPSESYFVIAGDQNADPNDGDSRENAARLLTEHPLVNHSVIPTSAGGAFYAESQAGENQSHVGDPRHDTSDFNPRVGNLRVDYCLPSVNLKILRGGVFWPTPEEEGHELMDATDHRMVWIDLDW
jgi:endonuclease/exonuclease/phosphatase family metal-dependent hydrolase